jgi:hypothetical protein
MILMERTQMEKILIVFYKMTSMMAMVAMELLMMLGMVMIVMVIPIADMTVATMEAVILQSMISTRKPQREAMHTLLGLLPPELMRMAHPLLALILKKVLGDRQGVPTAANSQMPNEVNPPQLHCDPSTVGPPTEPANYTDLFTQATTSNNERTNVVEGTNTFVPTEEPISTVLPPLCSNASIS